MTLQGEPPLARLVPAIGLALSAGAVAPVAISVMPGLQVELVVVAEHAERRDDVLLEVLVLVIAPDQHEIRIEIVEDLADRAEIVAEALAAAIGGPEAVVVAEFGQQLLRPVRRVLVSRIDIG